MHNNVVGTMMAEKTIKDFKRLKYILDLGRWPDDDKVLPRLTFAYSGFNWRATPQNSEHWRDRVKPGERIDASDKEYLTSLYIHELFVE